MIIGSKNGQPAPVAKIFLVICFLALSSCCDSNKIPSLIGKLSDPKARDRTNAALELARCGDKADRAVPSLARLLYDDNAGVQSAASYALRKIDTNAARAVMGKIDQVRREQKQH